MKVLTVVGARPQFIKAAALSRAIGQHNAGNRGAEIQEIIVHTGQHFDPEMSDVFFSELDLREPDIHLGIGGLPHGAMTGRMLEGIERVLLKESPDVVLVYGDTDSTIAGALATSKLHIRLAHVEAGLRSFNRLMPEELNRVLTDHAADFLFAPTEGAVENLRREGISKERIRLVGDVMYDSALYYADKAVRVSGILERLGVRHRGYVLATVHRAENTDNPETLRVIFTALREIATIAPVVMPLHPRTRKRLKDVDPKLAERTSQFLITAPLGYLDTVKLEQNAAVVVTDSGGMQKEAFFFRVPCVTLRSETEWTELVRLGLNRLAPPQSTAKIVDSVRAVLDNKLPIGTTDSPFGDGTAAQEIVRELLQSV